MMKLDFIHYHENAVIPQNILVSLPLKLEADDLLAKPRRGKMPTRPPNNFLIFRTAYTRVLQSKGHWDLRMREVTSNAAAAWKNASKEVREECRKLALVAKKKHEEVYGPPPRQTRRRRQTNKRRQPRRPSPAPAPAPVSPLMFEPSAHNTNINASFYFDDLISWQNIPYDMTFSPPESELGEPQPQFNSIYPPM
ncbi:unnamed protein product [Rhizophagus irregularis]|uniref:HMG box domain-containing protein n=4 Tax=Rhizophagus irregularis TaxID=588596 RepID=A0A2I1H0R4_9GLOM|nr:hypothetical protein RhiirA4_447248 [Rhizophagus irregularis]CAB4441910.1 unnamed protein product [Rhizophagus irregularis]